MDFTCDQVRGAFTNYVDKKRLVDGPKMTLFNFIR